MDPAKREAALAQYMEGVGQRATERLLGVSHNSITNWVKAEVCGKVLQATPAEKVAWVEADELWTYASKKDACWLWWAIDRGSKCVLGWSLGDRGIATAERFDAQLPHAAHIVFATDFWHPYGKIFAEEHHVQGKTHTFTIESLNNRIRCYLARLKRKTHNYSKSRLNLAASILFFIVKKCGGQLVSEQAQIPI